MSTVLPRKYSNLGFDPDALREKYREERDKRLRPDANEPPVGPEHSVGLMSERLLRRAASIYGGSNEIQRNVIAKAVLGL